MIETKAQAVRAIREIQSITAWSQREIAERAGIDHSVISRLLTVKGNARAPSKETRRCIYDCLLIARGLE